MVFSEQNAFSYDQSSLVLIVLELIRIFIDKENLTIQQAWLLVSSCCSLKSLKPVQDYQELWNREIFA